MIKVIRSSKYKIIKIINIILFEEIIWKSSGNQMKDMNDEQNFIKKNLSGHGWLLVCK